MVKVTNPGLTSSDKDKYLAAVKQHEKMEEEMIAKAAETCSEKSASKQDSPESVTKEENLETIVEKSVNNKDSSVTVTDKTVTQQSSSETVTEKSFINENEQAKDKKGDTTLSVEGSDNITTCMDSDLQNKESKTLAVQNTSLSSNVKLINKVENISENSEDVIIDVDSMETECEEKPSEKITATIENVEIDTLAINTTECKMDTTEVKNVVNEAGTSETPVETPMILSNKESLEGIQVTSNNDKNVKIQISVDNGDNGKGVTIPRSVASTDVTKPLTIETKFGGPSGPSSESTDTASEGGSCFSSPNTNSCQSSPQCSNGEGTLHVVLL